MHLEVTQSPFNALSLPSRTLKMGDLDPPNLAASIELSLASFYLSSISSRTATFPSEPVHLARILVISLDTLS